MLVEIKDYGTTNHITDLVFRDDHQPRENEFIKIGGDLYKIRDVVYQFDDNGVNYNIRLFVEDVPM